MQLLKGGRRVQHWCRWLHCKNVVAWAQGFVQEAKTRSLVAAMESWGLSATSHTLLIVDEVTQALELSSRNIPTLRLNTSSGLSVYDILRADNIVVEGAALTYIQVCAASLLSASLVILMSNSLIGDSWQLLLQEFYGKVED